MKIFIDFDDVLFNTKKFKADYLAIFKKNGISKKVFEECYYDEAENGKSIKQYDPIKHIERIGKINKIEIPGLCGVITDFVQDTSSYVFADVSVFLGKFKKNDLYLVSFSETDLQKMKIKNSGIAKKFRKIEIVNELKSKAIINLARRDKLPDDADIYFIDDRVEQIEDVKIKFPKIKTILLKRKEGRYKDSKNKYCNFVCYNLKQVEKIINGKYQPKRK